MLPLRLVPCVALVATMIGCVETRGSAWMQEPLVPDEYPPSMIEQPEGAFKRDTRSHTLGKPRKPTQRTTEPSEATSPVAGRSLGVFHNTYYSFPNEAEYHGEKTTIFDASCKPIAQVPRTFHDTLCVQGSGRLASRRTVSFAKRNCACAALCPRSGQKICYEALDPATFPWGRGAAGKPITPFRTIAVDSKVIPLGTAVYIPAYTSLPMPDGTVHDGCFLAEDRGLKVVGHKVDVFTGSEAATHDWNQRVPTAQGVEIFVGHPRCDAMFKR
ncbi:MAG: 3D domain-containing protein [Myxococcota bacterium]